MTLSSISFTLFAIKLKGLAAPGEALKNYNVMTPLPYILLRINTKSSILYHGFRNDKESTFLFLRCNLHLLEEHRNLDG